MVRTFLVLVPLFAAGCFDLSAVGSIARAAVLGPTEPPIECIQTGDTGTPPAP